MQQALPVPPIKDLTDAELAALIASGDMLALQHLMRRHNQTLCRTEHSILKDDAEAEDAVQEAYVLAYRAIDRFRGEAKLSTWLTRIAVNAVIRRARKLNRSAETRSPSPARTTWAPRRAPAPAKAGMCSTWGWATALIRARPFRPCAARPDRAGSAPSAQA